MRTFGYGRVSTADQTTDNQRQELETMGHNIEPHRWYTDTISGKIPAKERPQFAKMPEKGDMVVVAKLDRLGRDMIDVMQTLRHLTKKGVRVKVLASVLLH